MGEPEIPAIPFDSFDDIPKESPASPSVIRFKHGLSRRAADLVIEGIYRDIIPEYHAKDILLEFQPLFNQNDVLIGLDFGVPIEKQLKKDITKKLDSIISRIIENLPQNYQNNQLKSSSKSPVSFTELLGTFRIKVIYVIIPIMFTIVAATFLAWAAKIKAGLDTTIVEEGNLGEILLNGFIPVVISAVFITIIWFLIKKFGMIVFKILMGIIVFFYSWFGCFFFISAFFIIYESSIPVAELNETLINGLYNGLFYGTIVLFFLLMVLFFSNKLNIKQRNAIVLVYSIFMGSFLGISFPTWSTFSFAIFLSIWDLIAVFKGPLGKIGHQIQDNQMEMQTRIKSMLDEGQIGIDQVQNYPQFVSLQAPDDQETEESPLDLKQIEIELGSGDLILYSALIANIFVNYGSWFLAIMTIVGVLGGAAMTLYYLLTKKRMLPALPFSMAFGISLFFVGRLIQYLLAL